MGHCVYLLRPDSIYDDSPSEKYQFPKQYLERANNSIGDWIVYLEPSKVKNSRGYFAIARVENITPDGSAPGRFLALIEPGSYLDFPNPVSFKDDGEYVERGLLNESGKLSGRAQSAVRHISSKDFLRVLERGFAEVEAIRPRIDAEQNVPGLEEHQTPFEFETERQRVEHFVSRPIRKRAFRRTVLRAYDERCALTGVKFINGSGRAEVDAAHIQPVEHNGPDVVQNGIALSGTAHWMFDRGLVSLSDNLEILVSRQVNDIESVKSFINESGRAIPPIRPSDHPHPKFLRWHRENCFKH